MKAATARRVRRRWLRDCLGSFAVYGVAVFGAVVVADAGWPLALRVVALLAPLLPICYFAWAMVVFSRSWDELQRRILFESFLVGGGAVALGSFGWGWLSVGAGVPELHALWVLPALVGASGAAYWLMSRRYR